MIKLIYLSLETTKSEKKACTKVRKISRDCFYMKEKKIKKDYKWKLYK